MLADRVRAAVSALPGSVSASSASRSSHSGGTPPWSTPRVSRSAPLTAPPGPVASRDGDSPVTVCPDRRQTRLPDSACMPSEPCLNDRPAFSSRNTGSAGTKYRGRARSDDTVCSAAAAFGAGGTATGTTRASLIPLTRVSIVPSRIAGEIRVSALARTLPASAPAVPLTGIRVVPGGPADPPDPAGPAGPADPGDPGWPANTPGSVWDGLATTEVGGTAVLCVKSSLRVP